MAQSRALAAQGETISSTEVVVTSALGYQVWCSLPLVSDGSGVTVDDGHNVTVYANSTGSVEVVDHLGKRVAFVKPFTSLTFVARDNSVSPWQVVATQQSETGKIADLSVTDGASTAAASTFPAAYDDATHGASFDAQVEVVTDEIETNLAVSFAEVESKVNSIIAALSAAGVTAAASQAEGTDTLALAAVTTPQVVDDSERTVTSARAFGTIAVLPKIVAAGAGTAVPPTHTVRVTASSTGPITVLDFFHRKVAVCPAYGSITVKAEDADTNRWANLGLISEANAKIPVPTVAPLAVTMPTAAAPAMVAPATYADATWNSAGDTAIDAAFAGIDATCATAFAAVETTLDAVLVALEVADIVAAA